jgi:hypothetical protein
VRRLIAPVGVIPRGFKDHRSVVAKRYRTYCLAIQAQWGPLPEVALPILREAGLAVVELERLAADLEAARHRTKNSRRDASRVRRQQFMLREQLGRLEHRIEELAAAAPKQSLAQRFATRSTADAPAAPRIATPGQPGSADDPSQNGGETR